MEAVTHTIEHRPIIIPKATVDLLLKQDRPADLVALYLFYYYTAIWQKTNQPYCTDTFVKGKFGWGRDRIIRLRKTLIQIGLIEMIKGQRPKGEGAGRGFSKPFIKVKYYYGAQAVKEAELRATIATLEAENKSLKRRMSERRVSDSSGVGSQDTNAYSSNSINACSSNKKGEDRKTIPPSPSWVKDYAAGIDYDLDVETFMDYYATQGWRKSNGQMVRDWQGCVRQWKKRDDASKPIEDTGGMTLTTIYEEIRDGMGEDHFLAPHWSIEYQLKIYEAFTTHNVPLDTLHHLNEQEALAYINSLPAHECRIAE